MFQSNYVIAIRLFQVKTSILLSSMILSSNFLNLLVNALSNKNQIQSTKIFLYDNVQCNKPDSILRDTKLKLHFCITKWNTQTQRPQTVGTHHNLIKTRYSANVGKLNSSLTSTVSKHNVIIIHKPN